MERLIDNIVVIDRDDYDELVEKASATECVIKEQAKELYMKENVIPVKIEFYQYINPRNFSAPVVFSRSAYKREVYDALDKIEPLIKDWMDENMKMYWRKLKETNETERDCVALRKRVANLDTRTRELKIKLSLAISYAIAVTAALVLIFMAIKS